MIGQEVKRGEVLNLPFNILEGDGKLTDISGNQLHTTINGATQTTDLQGRSNCAYLFDGTNDFMNGVNNYTGIPFSLSIWFEHVTSSNNSAGLIGFSGNNGYRREIYLLSTGALRCFYYDGTNDYYRVTNIIESNLTGWHHAVLTYDGTTLLLYLDDVATTIIPTTTAAATAANNIYRIGRNLSASETAANYWSGKLNKPKIFSVALTPSEVTQLYYEGLR